MTVSPDPGASADVVRTICPQLAGPGVERAITVDQTNTSVVVDESVIVKWLNDAVPPPHPAVVALTHLTEVGFTEAPLLHGAHVVDGAVVALVHEYVPSATDGWEWFTDEFTGVVDGSVAADQVTESAGHVGRLAARLHVALATPSSVIPAPVRETDLVAEATRCERLLRAALAETTGEPGLRLAGRADRIRSAISVLDDPDRRTRTQPVHGDLHAGQFLRSADRLVIADFDGNPLASGHDGLPGRRPTAVDVASLVQSVDHVGRVAIKRRPDAADELDGLTGGAVESCLDAYRSELAAVGASDSLDDTVLWPLRVAQELHELVYAARHLPRWVYAPDATLRSMFPDDRST